MKTRYTGQDGTIDSYGKDFAEFVYDRFRPGDYLDWPDIEYPPFKRLQTRTVKLYTKTLLDWMVEQSPSHIQRLGLVWKLG